MDLPASTGTLKRMRDARLKQLQKIGPLVAGSLVPVANRNVYYLTDKVKKKTRTVCVPAELVDQCREWNENHKKAKTLLEELDAIQRALLQGEIEALRAARRVGS
jgi:hypothetical protein